MGIVGLGLSFFDESLMREIRSVHSRRPGAIAMKKDFTAISRYHDNILKFNIGVLGWARWN